MAIKTLCEAGLSVCALNSGRRLDPAKDFRNHKQPYDMPFRGLRRSRRSAAATTTSRTSTRDAGVWEHGIAYTTAPGTEWEWPRCLAVGGKTNFWGRSVARMGDIDFKAASRDGSDVDWPVTYAEIAPYYSRVERMIGVASARFRTGRAIRTASTCRRFKLRCLDYILQHGCREDRRSVPAGSSRAAHGGAQRPPRLSLLRQLHRGLRHRLVLLDAVFPAARGGEDRATSNCATNALVRECWWTATAARTASRTSIARRSRRSRCTRRSWSSRRPASSPRASC